MKHLQRYLYSFVVASLFCGCGQIGGGQGTATDTIVQDTIIVAEQLEPEPEPEPPFTSPDLKFKRLRGHVKRVEETTKWKWYSEGGIDHSIYRFSEKGRLIKDKTDRIKRNKVGQIVETIEVDDDGLNVISTYKYNKEGYVCEEKMNWDYEDFSNTIYKLDSRGWIISLSCRDYDFENITYGRYTENYAYSDIDEHGNWLKLIITRRHEALEAGDKPHSEKIITTRQITYWE